MRDVPHSIIKTSTAAHSWLYRGLVGAAGSAGLLQIRLEGMSRIVTNSIPSAANSFSAGGLVGTAEFAVLPQVGPSITAALVLAAQAPALAALWRNPAPAAFCDAVVQVGGCGAQLQAVWRRQTPAFDLLLAHGVGLFWKRHVSAESICDTVIN